LIPIHPGFTSDLIAKFENEDTHVLYKKDKYAQKYMEKETQINLIFARMIQNCESLTDFNDFEFG
jgi:hypothetical protein